MTVIATASNPRFTVSRVDIDRAGPTYTIDTLRDLKAQRPDAELFFITGADAVAQILSWRDHDELWDLAHFVAVSRPGHVLSTARPAQRRRESAGGSRTGDLLDGLPRSRAHRDIPSGTSFPTGLSSTSESMICTGARNEHTRAACEPR